MEALKSDIEILVVDDDPGFRSLLETILQGEGYSVDTAHNVGAARKACGAKRYSVVISDLKLPDGSGLDVQNWFAQNSPSTAFALITGFGSVATAVEAMKRGAVDYLEKPLRSPDELRRLVQRALALEPSPLSCATPASDGFACESLIARDPKTLKTLSLARRVAPTPATVLLLGESGTGKEVLARCIHTNSKRASGPFVAVNCAALAPTLIESELFGHEKGSFTGASDRHAGVFERANGGTIFLDEIGELDSGLQAKLLRVLQERSFERVGGGKTVQVDVRVVAATNRDLPALASQGKFRSDLYYRLSTFPIEIPPLRDRMGDLDALAILFLNNSARRMEKPVPEFTPEARAKLRAYSWPGNVRELENVMERAAILADDRVEPDHLVLLETRSPASTAALSEGLNMRGIERQAIEEALRKHAGNRTHAARELGISLRTLQYRLKEYGIS
jgi:two-component system response regulator FlrC